MISEEGLICHASDDERNLCRSAIKSKWSSSSVARTTSQVRSDLMAHLATLDLGSCLPFLEMSDMVQPRVHWS